jgi:hypothetical protein
MILPNSGANYPRRHPVRSSIYEHSNPAGPAVKLPRARSSACVVSACVVDHRPSYQYPCAMRTKDDSYPAHAPAKAARLKEDAPKPTGRPSSLVDTLVIYSGDCLDQLRKLPDAWACLPLCQSHARPDFREI